MKSNKNSKIQLKNKVFKSELNFKKASFARKPSKLQGHITLLLWSYNYTPPQQKEVIVYVN